MADRKSDRLIAELVDDLRPVQVLRARVGALAAGAGLAVALTIALFGFGIRPDLAAGRLDPMFLVSSGLYLILGVAAASTVISMGRPQVGNRHGGWRWAAATAASLPASALLIALFGSDTVSAGTMAGLGCAVAGSMIGLGVAFALTLWLRRGAPTSPQRAGLLTGIASGSLGIFAYAFHCTHDDLVHVGLWHALAIVLSAVLGRIAIPRLIRW